MDFDEAAKRYTELQVQRQNGSLSDHHYRISIDQLRVLDGKGTWWQPDPKGTGWIFWNGTRWQPGTPPLPVKDSPSRAPGAAPQDIPEARDGVMNKETFTRIQKSTPWKKRPQQWWDRFSVRMGIVVAVVWFIYSGIVPVISLVTTGTMREGFDLISPLLIIAMPLLLIWKRKGIDTFLMPIQSWRRKFSRKLLIGMGIAIPFLTAFIIYHVFQVSEYPLMYLNIVVGTLASYALVREPVLADNYVANPQTGRMPDPRVPLVLLAGMALCVRIVSGHDCLTDPLNAQDCMRTTGTAELLSGGVSAGVSGAVNGPTMLQTLSGGEGVSGGGGGGDPGDGGPLDNRDLCFEEGF